MVMLVYARVKFTPAVASVRPEVLLPGDPLTGRGRGFAPFQGELVAMAAAVPGVALAFYWMALAVARARRSDPRELLRGSG